MMSKKELLPVLSIRKGDLFKKIKEIKQIYVKKFYLFV